MAKKADTFNYRNKVTELEELVAALQNPDIQIDEATQLHADGLRRINELETYLQQAEIEVKKHVTS